MATLNHLESMVTQITEREEHNKRMKEREAQTQRDAAAAHLLEIREKEHLNEVLGDAEHMEWQMDVVTILSHGEVNGIPFKFDTWVSSNLEADPDNFHVDISRLDNGRMETLMWYQNDDGEFRIVGEASKSATLSMRVAIAEAVHTLL